MTLSEAYSELFQKPYIQPFAKIVFNYFCEKLLLRYLAWFWMHLLLRRSLIDILKEGDPVKILVVPCVSAKRGNVWCIMHQNIIRYIPLDI